jgi:hypothetical protein
MQQRSTVNVGWTVTTKLAFKPVVGSDPTDMLRGLDA